MLYVFTAIVGGCRDFTMCAVGQFFAEGLILVTTSSLTSLSLGFLWLCCTFSTSRPYSRPCEATRSRDGRKSAGLRCERPRSVHWNTSCTSPINAEEFLDESFFVLSPPVWFKTPGRDVSVDTARNLPRNPREPIPVGYVALAEASIVYDPDIRGSCGSTDHLVQPIHVYARDLHFLF